MEDMGSRKFGDSMMKPEICVAGIGDYGRSFLQQMDRSQLERIRFVSITNEQNLEKIKEKETIMEHEPNASEDLEEQLRSVLVEALGEESEVLIDETEILMLVCDVNDETAVAIGTLLAKLRQKKQILTLACVKVEGAEEDTGAEFFLRHVDSFVTDEISLEKYLYGMELNCYENGAINIDYADLLCIFKQSGKGYFYYSEESAKKDWGADISKMLEQADAECKEIKKGLVLFEGEDISLVEANEVMEALVEKFADIDCIWGIYSEPDDIGEEQKKRAFFYMCE